MRIAITQFDPDPDPAANADFLVGVAARAAADGASLLLAPEGSIVSFLEDPTAPTRKAAQRARRPVCQGIATGVRRAPDCDRRRNFCARSGFDTGAQHAGGAAGGTTRCGPHYQKIHLYDAFSFVESDTVAPGTQTPPVVEIGGLKVGFATCYDLRFPELFRVLQSAGAQVIAIASAWVRGPLKEEHWLTLLRARAIENTCYLVAADQFGRAGIGRSAAFDPFGLPMLDLGTAKPGYGLAEVYAERVAEVRKILPVVEHSRFRIEPVPARLVSESV